MHPRAEYCADCGHEFPAVAAHDVEASSAPILRRDTTGVRYYDEIKATYRLHKKPGSPASLLVEYHAGLRRVAREWVCLEHTSYARSKARLWWKRRAGLSVDPPATVTDALDRLHELSTTRAILVDERGKYPEIIDYEFNNTDTCREGSNAGIPAGGSSHRAVAS